MVVIVHSEVEINNYEPGYMSTESSESRATSICFKKDMAKFAATSVWLSFCQLDNYRRDREQEDDCGIWL